MARSRKQEATDKPADLHPASCPTRLLRDFFAGQVHAKTPGMARMIRHICLQDWAAQAKLG